ncbi:MAG: DUF1572 domain-containing protein [Acidobacteriota bacterium]|nr:DUF1572 domain-containing protein [Acidobacteriota bacterium]
MTGEPAQTPFDGRAWLAEVTRQYRRYKTTCERAAEQVPPALLFETVGRIHLSVGALLKHLAGNHRSRWRDFLTTDGEKPDRHRDGEFVGAGETPESVRRQWDEGWRITFATLESLGPDDLGKTVTIRGEPHTVVQAIQRNLTHLAYHTGQIVQLARHFAGDDWQTLSIPPGESEAHNARKREKWGDWSQVDEDGAV